MMKSRKVINPFSGRVISASSPTYKLLTNIGLKFKGAVYDIDGDNNIVDQNRRRNTTNNKNKSSDHFFLSAELVDPSSFPLTPEKLKEYPIIAKTFNWDLIEENKNNKNKKARRDQSLPALTSHRLAQVRDFLQRGAQHWCRIRYFGLSSLPASINSGVPLLPSPAESSPSSPAKNGRLPSNLSTLLSETSAKKSFRNKHPVGSDGGTAHQNLLNNTNGIDNDDNDSEQPPRSTEEIFSCLSPSSREQLSKFTLTPDQQAAIDLAKKGHSLYIGGNAGVGKTLALQRIAVELSSSSGKKVAVTASTGISALALGGQTFHRLFAPNDSYSSYEKKSALVKYDVIIIDEISMFTASMIEYFDRECRRARPWAAHLPFGGVQLILSGDFMQLHVEPRNPDWLMRSFLMAGRGGVTKKVQRKAIELHKKMLKETAHETRHVFESPIFQKHVVPICLETKMRHKDDDRLGKCLDELRQGKVNQTFLSRCFTLKNGKLSPAVLSTKDKKGKEQKQNEQEETTLEELPSVEKAIYLFPTRLAADYHNEMCLSRIQGETRIFEPKKVVLGPNGDWCEPVSVLAVLDHHNNNNDHLHHTGHSTMMMKDKNDACSSASTAFFKLPRNVEKARRQLKKLQAEHNITASSLSASSSGTTTNKKKKISIRPGNRISISAATAVQERLKEKIVAEMIAMNPRLFNKNNNKKKKVSSKYTEPIVMHIDHRHNHHNHDKTEHQSINATNKTKTNKNNCSSSKFGTECRHQLTNGVCLATTTSSSSSSGSGSSALSPSLPVNIRIKKTDQNQVSLEVLQEKMKAALDSLFQKGVVANKSPQLPHWDPVAARKNNNYDASYDNRDSNTKKSSTPTTDWDQVLKKHEERANSIRCYERKDPTAVSTSSSSSADLHHHSRKQVDRDVTVPRALKVGSRVMLIRNISPTLVNGSMGTILGFEVATKAALPKDLFWSSFVGSFLDDDGDDKKTATSTTSKVLDNSNKMKKPTKNSITTDFDEIVTPDEQQNDEALQNKTNGGKIITKPSLGTSSTNNQQQQQEQILPRVKFDNGEEVIIPMYPEMILGSSPDPRTNFNNTRISFMPLKISFSTTVHKIQGCTIASSPVVLDLSRSWNCDHLVYVAASRVKRLEQLYVLNFHERHVCVNSKAQRFSQGLKNAIQVLRRVNKKSQ